MELAKFVLRNQFFYFKKTALVAGMVGLMLFMPIAAVMLVNHVKTLAERPLNSLQTELILQNEQGGNNAGDVKTTGIILPFNLQSVSLETAREKLAGIGGIREYSTNLVLWQFDLRDTRTIMALNIDEPRVGPRRIESLLMPGSRFFSGNAASEAILERHYAKLFNHEIGKELELAGEKLRVVGIVDFKDQSNLSNASVFLPYDTGLRLAGQKEAIVNQLFLSLRSSADMGSVKTAVEGLFPGYSLITKDSLYKNLSSFNQLLYRFGNWFVMTIIPVSLFLAGWILKMHRMEHANLHETLTTIGWPSRDRLMWQFCDAAFIAGIALVPAFILAAILQWQVIPEIQVSPLLNQGFKL